MNDKLRSKLDNIVDAYYKDSDDYKNIALILDEVEFLYTRGILINKSLGRANDIVYHAMKN